MRLRSRSATTVLAVVRALRRSILPRTRVRGLPRDVKDWVPATLLTSGRRETYACLYYGKDATSNLIRVYWPRLTGGSSIYNGITHLFCVYGVTGLRGTT